MWAMGWGGFERVVLAGATCWAALSCAPIVAAQPQRPDDRRSVHELAVYATVVVETGGGLGTGWLLAQNGPMPVILTNRHVVEPRRPNYRIRYYAGTGAPPVDGTARLLYLSRRIDLAVLLPDALPPETARMLHLEDGDVIRGEQVVLAGHPHRHVFQTTEGAVAGASPEMDLSAYRCGYERNCIVVDAPAFQGSSGGPALNARGRVVGMLWAAEVQQVRDAFGRELPLWATDSSFAYLIHVRVIEQELRQVVEDRNRREGARR